MVDYTRLYCVSDTVLLCEVMEQFRDTVHKKHGLDPANFISLPGLSKDIMLKSSKIRLDYMHDLDMIYLVKHSIRGGLSYVSTRFADIVDMEQKTGQKHCILYVDANSLYGCSMSHKLPVGEYSWLSQHELDTFDVSKMHFESEYGYALSVTLSYPSYLHEKHNSYPLCAEHITVEYDRLSPQSKKWLESMKLKYVPVKKLTATFAKREEYFCHAMCLKLYLELGLVLEKIHCGIRFRQGDYMANFVKQQSLSRRNAKTKIESLLCKKLVNCCFGKISLV